MGACSLGCGEIGGGEVSSFRRKGLIELTGVLALAVDLVIAKIAEDVGDGDSAGGRLAMMAAAVAIEVGGCDAILLEQLLVA